MTIQELLLIVVERYRKDRKAQESYTDHAATTVAQITLDAFMNNLELELKPHGLTLEGIAPR